MKTLLLFVLLFCTQPALADFAKGLDAYQKGDYATAMKELKSLAEQGNDNAQNILGLMHQYGQGVTKDYKIAVKWYTLAAGQGHVDAKRALALIPCTLIKDQNDWVGQSKACPSSPGVAYNAVIQLQSQNKRLQASQLLADSLILFKTHEPLQKLAKDLPDWPSDPYRLIAYLTDKDLKAWVANTPPPELFSAELPERQSMPALPELVKDEFETVSQFKVRIEKAKELRQSISDVKERKYQLAVSQYNEQVKQYNLKLENDKSERPQKIAAHQRQLLSGYIAKVLGKPALQNLNYNAEEQLFFGQLVSSHGNFDQPVKFSVPLINARALKENISFIVPMVSFSIENNRLVVNKITVPFSGQEYLATLTSDVNIAPVLTAKLDDSSLQTAYASLSTIEPSNPEKVDDSDFFNTALILEADPELARLKQQQAELSRQAKVVRQQQAVVAERNRLKLKIAQQQAALAGLGGGMGDQYKGLKPIITWAFEPARAVSDTVMVIIGNRAYKKGVPPVYYAHNDARAMREFALSGLGLQAEDILYEEDATKGVMEGLFKSTLPARIKAGKKNVIVYFSGHGMAAENDAKLLPVDARPNTAAVTGYSRNALLDQLASLGVNSTVILDACYTGTNKDGAALIEGKPIFKAPKGAFVPNNITLISAASGNQIAWMDDKTGHSLMTYHLLKGLQGLADKNRDRRIDSEEIANYLKASVNRSALILHEQSQEPEVQGINQLLLSY